jgi:hypothetical protein
MSPAYSNLVLLDLARRTAFWGVDEPLQNDKCICVAENRFRNCNRLEELNFIVKESDMHTCILFCVMLLRVDAINSVKFSVRSLKLLAFDVQYVQLVLICKCMTSVKRLRAKQKNRCKIWLLNYI